MAGGRPIEIPLGIESSDAERGAERIADALDDVSSAADDLGRDGGRGADRLADSLDDASDNARDMGRDVERATGDVEDGLENAGDAARDMGDRLTDAGDDAEDAARDAARVIDRDLTQALDDAAAASGEAGDTMGRNIRQGAEAGAEGGGEVVGEFSDEARSNFSEVASSFSGDMTSAVDLVQGTLGGLAGSIPGGVGLALGGLAIAAGTFAQQWSAEAERTEERIGEMYEDMLASGKAYISDSYIQDQYYKIVQGAEGAILSQKDLDKIVGQTGLTQERVALAFAGNGEQMQAVQEKLNEHKQTFLNQLEDEETANDSAAKAGASWADQSIEQANKRSEAIRQTETDYQAARDALSEYGAVGAGALRDLTSAEIDYSDTVQTSIGTIQANGAQLDVNTEAGRANAGALIDQAEAAEGVRDALAAAGGSTAELTTLTAAQREAFIYSAEAAGNTEQQANDLADAYGLIPESVSTDARVTGGAAARAELDGIATDRNVNINAVTSPYEWQRTVDNTINGLRVPAIVVQARLGQAAI